MFKIFSNAFRVKEIRQKIYFVLFIIAVYRLGTTINLPGINVERLQPADLSAFTIASIIGGGMGTIFTMGIGPYITSSIVMQLLTYAIPYLEQLKKEGQDGIDKINQITRVLAVGLAILQASAEVYKYVNFPIGNGVTENLFKYNNTFVYLIAVLAMVTGTIFIMWLSELVDQRGFGNGTSFIIFANILAGFPQMAGMINQGIIAEYKEDWQKYCMYVVVLLLFMAVIYFAVFIQDGERRIPVQYSKKMVGRQLVGGQSSFIPLKVNIAGVMSIIFAMSLLGLPQIISGFVSSPWITTAMTYLNQTHPVGAVLYIILIFAFTFFYTSFAINPTEMAENIKKSGGFIPGTRPGKPTSDYIDGTVNRLSWIGATFYALIALIPIVFQWIFRIEVGFGGTTLLIVSGAALDIVKQLESLLLTRHYGGILKKY